jgi:hypothetical protein
VNICDDYRLVQVIKQGKFELERPSYMSNSARQKPLPRTILILIALGVVGLGVVFALLATIGDDVGNSLPTAGQTSPGD